MFRAKTILASVNCSSVDYTYFAYFENNAVQLI